MYKYNKVTSAFGAFGLLALASSLKSYAAPVASRAPGLSVKFDTCQESGSVDRINIDPCTEEDCDIVYPDIYNVTIEFTPSSELSSPRLGVYAYDDDDSDDDDEPGFADVDFANDKRFWKYGYREDSLDACLYTTCPLAADETATLTYSIDAASADFYDDIDRFLFTLTDGSNNSSNVCVSVKVDADGPEDRDDRHDDNDNDSDDDGSESDNDDDDDDDN